MPHTRTRPLYHPTAALQSLHAESVLAFVSMCVQLQAKTSAAEDEEVYGDAPEEFEDPLSCRIMKDPVLLPSGRRGA